MKYHDILTDNIKLYSKLSDKELYSIGVLSNITINQIKEVLEYSLRISGINANVDLGNYDNIVQDSHRFNKYQLVIIFWETINLIDGLQYKCELMTDFDISNLIERIKGEIDYVLDNLKLVPAVLLNQFTSLVFNGFLLEENSLDRICNELNEYLKSNKRRNVTIINVEKVIAKISIDKAVDLRFYYLTKALYTIGFFKEYVEFILPIPLYFYGKKKKALIFDCDNTLWKGILGEDGFNEIVMSSKQKGGTPFEEVQSLALALKKKGVLIGLCSKNNAADVDEVIEKNPFMTIRDKDLTIKMVNWNDKVSNLRDIQRILNIGFDSFIFIDDSDFELEFISKNLPDVTTVKMPQKIVEYPIVFRKASNLFYSPVSSSEDAKRVEMYREQIIRQNLKQKFNTLVDYLQVLEMRVDVFINEKKIVPRISQMTQKTNQFNLTTKRYSEIEILSFIDSNTTHVFAISVTDKFGDNGITGLAIIHQTNHTAHIDTFLLSCRIIGRNIEIAFLDFLIDYLNKKKIKRITAEYIKTLKNDQVCDFYDKHGFRTMEKNASSTKYELLADSYKRFNIDYIQINHEK